MALLLVLTICCTFGVGYLTRLLQESIRDAREARIDELVRDAADANPERGLGL